MKFNFEDKKKHLKNALLTTVATVGMIGNTFGAAKESKGSLPKTPEAKEMNASKAGTLSPEEQMAFEHRQFEMKVQEMKDHLETLQKDSMEQKDILAVYKADRDNLFWEFSGYQQGAVAHLDKRDAKKFETVAALPYLIQKEIFDVANLPGNAKVDFNSVTSFEDIKSHVLNFDNKELGPIVQNMVSVANSNNLASVIAVPAKMQGTVNDGLGERSVTMNTTTSDAITYNAYFGNFTGKAIHAVTKIVMQERKVAQINQELKDYENTMNEFLLAHNGSGSNDVASR